MFLRFGKVGFLVRQLDIKRLLSSAVQISQASVMPLGLFFNFRRDVVAEKKLLVVFPKQNMAGSFFVDCRKKGLGAKSRRVFSGLLNPANSHF